MRVRVSILLALAFALAACAGRPTPYQPKVDGTGYTEQQLDGRTWRVTFAGNDRTPRETVENYLLYRCAEVMLFGGYDHFIVLEKVVEPDVHYYTYGYTPGYIGPGIPPSRYSYYRYRHRYAYPYRPPYRVGSTVRYRASALIRPWEDGPPPEGALVFDAKALVRQLGPGIVLPDPQSPAS
jgi:hypothetical protein